MRNDTIRHGLVIIAAALLVTMTGCDKGEEPSFSANSGSSAERRAAAAASGEHHDEAGSVAEHGGSEEPSQAAPPPGLGAAQAAAVDVAALSPDNATEEAPAEYDVVLETTKGPVRIHVTRAWAPHAADRFYNLVKLGYYDDAAFFRVMEGFMAQVGMHGDPAVNRVWEDATIPDDEVTQSNTPGMVTFAARSVPNSRTTQFFINMGDNSNLDQMGFAPFGKTDDLEVVHALFSGYGEGAPRGEGPFQMRISAEGNQYLRAEFPNLDYIQTARVVEDEE